MKTESEQECWPNDRLAQVLQAGEKVLWAGAPAIRHFLALFVFSFVAGLLLFLGSAFFLYLLIWGAIDKSFPLEAFPVGGLPALFFMALGGACSCRHGRQRRGFGKSFMP